MAVPWMLQWRLDEPGPAGDSDMDGMGGVTR